MNESIFSLRQTSNFLNSILRSSTEYAITVVDLKGRITFWNTCAERLTGFPAEDVVGKKCIFDFFSKKTKNSGSTDNIWEQALKAGKHNLELEIICKKRKKLPICLTITPLYNQNHTLIGTLGVFRDISNELELRKKLDDYTKKFEHYAKERAEMLEPSRAELTNIFKYANDGILIHGNGIIQSVNEALLKMTGYSEDELIGSSLFDFIIAEEQRETVRQKIAARLSGVSVIEPFPLDIRVKSGQVLHVQAATGLISRKPPCTVFIITKIEKK
ncbi:PAS domain S-box protein [bacterium]|nr:PAS domain S-box protein [bacterium]